MQKLAVQTRIIALLFVVIVLIIVAQTFGLSWLRPAAADDGGTKKVQAIPEDFQAAPYPDTEEGKQAAYGEKLIRETAKYLGPGNTFGEVYAGNNLACGSCHLNGGTKPYAAPYIGLTALFPVYSGREGKVASLETRINGCFERSLNGRKLPLDSKEMMAIVSYMKHLSRDVQVGGRIAGQGFVEIAVPERKADLVHGEAVFKKQCISCHQESGQGMLHVAGNKSQGYLYPPLWGEDSYNDGAGMARMLTAAKFIKGNMPLGATAENPLLSDEEAYDVAAYINSFERPQKAGKELDYPDLSKKPKDSAYPPFADTIPAEQHKYGPFNF